MEGEGPHSDVVVSSRIRLARNLSHLPFPGFMTPSQEKEMTRLAESAIQRDRVTNVAGKLELIPLWELTELEKQLLVEKHLISPELARARGKKAVILSEDEAFSIMINEEDHLRIQCLLPALRLEEGWEKSDALDDALGEELDYAFNEEKGYLTACPTNVGTGLRASTMVHLPGLMLTRQAGEVLTALTKIGIAVRGLYGEGTEAQGNFFQISNQISLGLSEEEIIKNLSAAALRLADQERQARELLKQQRPYFLEDRVGRAYGILAHGYILSSQEALQLLSDLRLGVAMGFLPLTLGKINQLMVKIQPSYLQLLYGREMNPWERDVYRARLVREFLKEAA